ncbi:MULTISPECIES: LEVG family PEP-CTERM protein [Fischerella]|nr:MULTISPECIES: LEVG family PEP-CTERM protein [Fischerella]MBD2432996.1 LEVG family PEP-CTERM protein [Fischerella sp. FACHB-380]
MVRIKFFTHFIAASSLVSTFLSMTSVAHASSLIPKEEGEIQLTNLACLSNQNPKCIDTALGSNGYKVTSLEFDKQFSVSRLFVDQRNTTNDYSKFGIQFLADDEGTNPSMGEYWLRPVAYTAPVVKKDIKTSTSTQKNLNAPEGATVGTKTNTTAPKQTTTTRSDGTQVITEEIIETTITTRQIMVDQKTTQTVYNEKTKKYETKTVTVKVPKLVQDVTTKTTTQTTTITPGKPVENGRLEVGRFKFEFNNPLAGIKLNFFDVEDFNYTGILSYTNSQGQNIYVSEMLTGLLDKKGKIIDGTIQSLTLKDVKSFVVQLGNPGKKYGYQSIFSSTGDGVRFQLETVPEPSTLAGLGTLAILGILGSSQLKRKTSC